MIIWLFAILDAIVLVLVSLAHFGEIHVQLIMFAAGYLLVKGVLLIGDWMSKVEVGIAIYIFVMASFGFSTFIDYLIAVWFLYKLAVTVIGSL